jgi:hypothetical protein
MTAIISITHDDTYLFYLPLVAWAWNKIGCDVVVIGPDLGVETTDDRIELIIDTRWENDISFHWVGFNAPPEKEATYAQCSRLYASAFRRLLPDDEVLITSDVDMAVFNNEYFDECKNGQVYVLGAGLVPNGQYPMCYISMAADSWREVMNIKMGETMQEKLDQLLGDLECEHFRGNYWCKDQETIHNRLWDTKISMNLIPRHSPGTQFATRRADRDGWPDQIPPDIIDAHLPRPGYTDENFARIMNLFKSMYPNEDLQWMVDYRDKYVSIINPINTQL